MFIIVENQSVILGPMPWRSSFFQSCLLDDLEIQFEVPKTNSNSEVIIVSDSVKIMPVSDLGIIGDFNGKIQHTNGPYYNFYDQYAEVYYTPQDKPIDFVKSELKQIVTDNRYKYEISGIKITIQGKEVIALTNRGERDIYLQAYQLGKDTVTWKFGSEFLILSNSDLGLIVTAVSNHVQDTFNWESGKYSEIDAYTTLAELNSVVLESDNQDWNQIK